MANATCEDCGQIRVVGRNMAWRIKTGRSTQKCRGCCSKGNQHRLGIKQPEWFAEQKRQEMLGNSYAKGHHRPLNLVEADKERLQGNTLRKGYKADKVANWRGDKVGYYALHHWIYREYGRPDTCEHCQTAGLTGHKIHWANKSGEYLRDRADWLRLCASCHKRYDKENGVAIHSRFLMAGKRG